MSSLDDSKIRLDQSSPPSPIATPLPRIGSWRYPAQWAFTLIFILALLSHPDAPKLPNMFDTSWIKHSVADARSQTALDQFVAKEFARAYRGVLANVGPSGSLSKGAYPGVVIASPSTENPDYLFTWTRDSALVTKALVDQLRSDPNDAQLQTILSDYATSQARIQQVSNPSGTLSNGGLGEPKFHVNETAFNGSWGRPQRDGPALRAITLIELAEYLGPTSTLGAETLLPTIKADLDYVCSRWNETGFDLWEEVAGSSFFTTAVQYRALVQGYALTGNESYQRAAEDVFCFLQDYWNEEGYAVANLNSNVDRTGKDINSVLTSIHLFDSSSTICDSATFQPCSDRALANHKLVVDSFRDVYKVNKNRAFGRAAALGRYAEDVYYGGNPWYLATLAAAQQLYYALSTWKIVGSLNITEVSLPFFQDLVSAASVGSFSANDSDEFAALTKAVTAYADDFMSIVAEYTPADGSLAEQFDRTSGTPLSASDLTWSYASFLTATSARSGRLPSGWGTGGVQRTCSDIAPLVKVTFKALVTTAYGELIYLVGSSTRLGSWNPSSGVALLATEYTAATPLWQATVYLPPSTQVEYKLVRQTLKGDFRWESRQNRLLTTNGRGGQIVEMAWQS